jgi:protein-L-isoaspartate O-methyltransferase
LTYERAMLADGGGTIADKTGPEKGGACRCWASRGHGQGWSYIQKVNKVSVTVLDNWGNGGRDFTRTIPFDKLAAVMTAAEVQAACDTGQLVHVDATGFYLRNAPLPEPKEEKPAEPAAPGIEAMRQALKEGVKVVAVPQLFPTPPDLAARVVELADIKPGHRVLEPSAGMGALLQAIGNAPDKVAVEINATLVERLACAGLSGLRVHQGDFLACNGDLGEFDRVVMNPPFENGADIRHIEHALAMLKPGGRLVAICANGPRQRERLMPLASEWEDLPDGSFKEQGTNVSAALLIIERCN